MSEKIESEAYQKVLEKDQKWSKLSFTAEDHRIIGSTIIDTPLEILTKHPDKTWAELMSDQEIIDYLRSLATAKDQLQGLKTGNSKRNREIERNINQVGQDLQKAIRYLENIGRLPEEFQPKNK